MDLSAIERYYSRHVPTLQEARSEYAVLLPLLQKPDGLHLLYEMRASSLQHHRSEVCFPGGRMERGESPAACALRETWEELGIAPDRIRIFGEADFLPGLTVDKYEDVLVVESLALGIEKLKTLLLASLVQVLQEDGIHIRGIYERSDAKVREKEGLARTSGFLSEEFDTNVAITENGVRYIVDVRDGQKTGFFLDQKENRKSIWPICRGKDVLDCFTHTGSFGLNAAAAGAAHVTSIDASELAITQARENAKLNGFEDRIEYVVGDVFDFLPSQRAAGRKYDVVILDPPAFTKSRNSVKAAAGGYREINRQGLHLVKDGGFLATCSCSHFMTADLFQQTIAQAARDAHKRLRQGEFRQQGPDHPILWANDASYYLKFYIFQVVEDR